MAKKRSRQQIVRSQSEARYRKLYTAAKRKGLVKDRGPAKSVTLTPYMRSRLNKLEPYLGSDYAAVKAPPELQKIWRDAPSEIVPMTFNRRLIVRREPGVRVSTRDGILSLRSKLKEGQFEELPLPTNVRTLNEFKEWVENNRYYNDILKHRNERFNFRIWTTSNSWGGYGDLEALIGSLEGYQNYEPDGAGQLTWGDDPEFWTQFSLFRSYKDWKFERDKPDFQARARQERKDRTRAWQKANWPAEKWEAKLERERANRRARRKGQPSDKDEIERKRIRRENMSAAEREAMLKEQRERMRKLRAKRKKPKDK